MMKLVLLNIDFCGTLTITPISQVKIAYRSTAKVVKKKDGCHIVPKETEYDRGWNACVDEFLKIIQENEA